jgi:transcriptional regulator with XRE-family HTH domain
MPRLRTPARGNIGTVLSSAIDSLGLTPQHVAAAARVHKGTLYKILSGVTRAPHHSTLRSLCKVLCLDIAELLGAEQLEMLGTDLENSGALSGMEQLLVLELQSFPKALRQQAVDVAVLALLEVKLGMGGGAGTRGRNPALRRKTAGSVGLAVRHLRGIPNLAQPAAVRSALGALLDLRMIRGDPPTPELFGSMHRLRRVLWRGLEQAKRKGKTEWRR